jgi:hypothetical protein
MRDDDYARRPRTLLASKKARFEEAFERMRQELKELDTSASGEPRTQFVAPAVGFGRRKHVSRPLIKMPQRGSLP